MRMRRSKPERTHEKGGSLSKIEINPDSPGFFRTLRLIKRLILLAGFDILFSWRLGRFKMFSLNLFFFL